MSATVLLDAFQEWTLRIRTSLVLLLGTGSVLLGEPGYDWYWVWATVGGTARPISVENIVSLVLSISVFLTTWRLFCRPRRAIYLSESAKGCVLGCGALTGLSLVTPVLQTGPGMGQPPVFLLSAFGAAGGIAVGVYTAHLKRTRSDYQRIIGNVSDGIFRSTSEGELVYANQAFAEMFGYDHPSEILTVDPSSLYADPEQRTRLREEAQDDDQIDNVEVEFRRKDGMTFTGLLTSTIERDDAGSIQFYDGLITDVTERKKQEQALIEAKEEAEEAEALFETIFENVPVMVQIIDLESGDQRVNDHLEEVLGWTSEELQEHANIVELFYDTPEQQRRVLNIVREPPEGWVELQPRTKDGDTIYTLWTVTSLPNNQRLTIGLDITDRKQREQALEVAKEEAEEASRLKSAMLANMSHEIRTPLTSILGFAEAIGEEVDSDEAAPVVRFARLIEKSGRRLMETLDGVLNLSKLEAGEMDLAAEDLDVARVAAEIIEQLEPQAAEAEVELEMESSGAVWVRADEGGLQIVLRNLLSNAIKYTGEGGHVWLRTYDDDQAAVLEVEDTGVGMDPTKVDELFKPFRQGSEGASREYEGTGLGLAVTKQIVEEMGGTIEVETEKGGGTSFTVRLSTNPDAS